MSEFTPETATVESEVTAKVETAAVEPEVTPEPETAPEAAPAPKTVDVEALVKKFVSSLTIRHALFGLLWLIFCLVRFNFATLLLTFIPMLLLMVFDEKKMETPKLVTAALLVGILVGSYRYNFYNFKYFLQFVLIAALSSLPLLHCFLKERFNTWVWVATPVAAYLLLYVFGIKLSAFFLLYSVYFAKGLYLDRLLTSINIDTSKIDTSRINIQMPAPSSNKYPYLAEYKKNMKNKNK